MKLRMTIMLVAVVVVFGGIFGFKAFGNYMMNQFFDNMPVPPVTVTATEVKAADWTPSTRSVGSFQAVNGTELAMQMGGIVTGIHFENGQSVAAGQRLLSLDVEVDEAELSRLQAALNIAQSDASRLQRLAPERNISESELQRAQSQVAQAQAAVQAQQALIRQKSLRAPFDGVLGLRHVNLGQYLSPGQSVVSLESLDPLFLNFSLPEQRVRDITEQQVIHARVDAYPDMVFDGEVTAIEPTVNVSSRTVQIQATFSNSEGLLRPGMFARVELETGSAQSTLVIPQTAVQFNPYGNMVYIINEHDDELRVRQRIIQTGETRGDLIAIVDGLEQGDRIVTSGLLKLRNEAVININDDESLQPPAEENPQPRNR